MTASVHFFSGAATALLVQRYIPKKISVWFGEITARLAVALSAAILSHVLFDLPVHAEYDAEASILRLILIIESLTAFALLYSPKDMGVNFLLLTGMIGAAIPDLLIIMSGETGLGVLLVKIHNFLHVFHGTLDVFYFNFFWQGMIVLFCLAYVKFKTA